jgi:phage terminase Nu1 subunit (DNA packaging protein)
MSGSLQFGTAESGGFLPSLNASDFEEWTRAEDLARVFQVSTRRLYQLAEKGILPRPRNGRWPLREATGAYIQHLLSGGLEKRGAGATGASERARLAAAQRERIELKLAREKGELIPVESYKTELRTVLGFVRDALLGLPKRVAPLLAQKPEHEILPQLEGAVRDALVSLSNGEGLHTSANTPAAEDQGEDQGGLLQTNAKTDRED